MLCNLAGVLFHATSVKVSASCALFSLLILISKRPAKSDYSRRIAGIPLAICKAAGLTIAPFFWQITEGWHGARQAWGYGPVELMLQMTKRVQIPIVRIALLGVIFLLRKNVLKAVFFAVGTGVPVVVLLIGSVVIPPMRPLYMFYTLSLVLLLRVFSVIKFDRHY